MATRRKPHAYGPIPTGPAALVRTLDQIKLQFDRKSATRKLKIMGKLKGPAAVPPRLLSAYHDLLCFLRAYPDHRRLLDESERQLREFGHRIEASARPQQLIAQLENSGITNTTVVHLFSYELTRHLMTWHPGKLDIEWDDVTDEQIDALFKILTPLVAWAENDSLDYDPEIDIRGWLDTARARKSKCDLDVLFDLLGNPGIPVAIQRQFFDELNLSVRWELGRARASRTLRRLPPGRLFFQTEPRRGRCADLHAELIKPKTPLELLSRSAGREYVRAIQEVLAVRYRELFPVTFASPTEVCVNRPGRGIQIVLYGMVPDMRLPFETNFGIMLVRNGLPIGYGVAATWFERTEIAINVFPAFRSGESAFIFEQLYRVFHHHFGTEVFLVRTHQLGEDDEEPLESGAFWFYYKLGFRPVKAAYRKRAEREAKRIAQNPGYRCSRATLKGLSGSDLYLHCDPTRTDPPTEPSLVNLAYAVTRYFARQADGDRSKGTELAVRQVARTLSLRGWSKWPADEIIALKRLAPLIASIPNLRRWSPDLKRDLAKIIRAKGGRQERKYIMLCNRHPRFRTALEELGKHGR